MALHCCLGRAAMDKLRASSVASGFGARHFGYGLCAVGRDWPRTLDGEIARSRAISRGRGALHVIGHSYGGAIAFRLATLSPMRTGSAA